MAHRARNTTDILTEDTLRTFFRDAMHEEGVKPDSVETVHWQDDAFGNEKYAVRVSKRINGEPKDFQFTIDATSLTANNPDRLQQEMAMAARNIAHELEDAMIDTIEVCGTRLKFCAAEGGWAECARCDERISLSELQFGHLGFASEAELSNPAPTPYDIQNFLKRLDNGEQEVLKLYLLGALRNHCSCEFGKRGPYYR